MKIGLIDDGVCIDKELKKNVTFTGKIPKAGNVVIDEGNVSPYSHGTICAKIIVKQCTYAEICSLKILDDTLSASVNQLSCAITWCIENDIKLINLSLGTVNSIEFSYMKTIMQQAYDNGIIIVAAFNNFNTYTMPASLPFVVGVKTSINKIKSIREARGSFIGENIVVNSQYCIRINNQIFRTPRCNSFAAPAVTGKLYAVITGQYYNPHETSILETITNNLKKNINEHAISFLYKRAYLYSIKLFKYKKTVPVVMYNGKKYYLRKLQDRLMQENIFSIDIENFREKIFAEVILQRIAGKVDCDLIFLSNVEISLKCVDVIIINDMEECQNILEIRNLKKSYMINKENSLQVLKGLNISIGSGEMVALMGASGCGKTTLINLICGIDKADSGSIMIDHEEITKMRRSKMAVFRRNNIGLIFQDFNLLESLNVKDNILLPLILENRIEDSEEKLKQIAEVLSIADIMGKSVTDISGGQKQRVAIARALINTPQIILADEPTGNLDSKSTENVMEYLVDINRKFKITLVMVTHDSYAASFCDKVILLKDGIQFLEIEKNNKSNSTFLKDIYELLKRIGGE